MILFMVFYEAPHSSSMWHTQVSKWKAECRASVTIKVQYNNNIEHKHQTPELSRSPNGFY
jgi:hypothetical protein